MEIAQLAKKDVSRVASLLKQYWMTERNMPYTLAWAKQYVEKGHARDIKNDFFFVLKHKNVIVGCISLVHYEGDVGEIKDFVVRLILRVEKLRLSFRIL